MTTAVQVGLPRILVIDDDALLARAMGRMLSGFTVEIETDPRRALARIKAGEAFEVIVCDLKMPGMGGREVLASIRAHYLERGDTPNVIMTSGSDELDADIAAVDTPVLLKPFRGVALRALVASMIE
mgnify:CR=1 FL=1